MSSSGLASSTTRSASKQRGLEVALSLVAVVIFGQALLSGTMAPALWLILPFFAVFLPTIWAITLRGPRRRPEDASEAAGIYARLRVWLGGTHWLNYRLRGRWLREYRSVRRIV